MDSVWTISGLVLAGFVLLLFEILTPLFGLMLALGLGAFGAAVWMTYRASPAGALVMAIVLIVAIPPYLILLVKLLPRAPLSRRFFLRAARRARGEGTPEAGRHVSLVGATGLAETTLRPVGAVRLSGKRVIASAESGMIEKGQKVKVVRATGTNVVVRRVETES